MIKKPAYYWKRLAIEIGAWTKEASDPSQSPDQLLHRSLALYAQRAFLRLKYTDFASEEDKLKAVSLVTVKVEIGGGLGAIGVCSDEWMRITKSSYNPAGLLLGPL